ncbi:acyl-CoA thioesterase [Massilia glaciei]|uniref:Acyl-CoA thioesterase n=1 Tax=Massilia glaciei TaxID=1524097 RepID=A0A2U2HMB8_9BURK|nr:acyl-CoA thioesterase [Massilia glaciei]PWF48664.1 acyl-CoA thioesterase [Massilia glaciei]
MHVHATPSDLALARPLSAAIPTGELAPAPRTFTHEMTIYLKDSNAYGNTYFARYFEWQGVCRERWFFECIAPDMLQAEGVFITKRAEQDYVHETFPFQEIRCELNAYAVRKCSFWLEFRFFSGGTLVSVGRQQIVFANHAKQISALPERALSKIRRFEVPRNALAA